jgi:hypothetical protein
LLLIEILKKIVVQVIVGRQFIGVHTVADDIAELDLRWQVRHPAAHEVQHVIAGAQTFTVQVRETVAERLVDVLNESGLPVERAVRP